MNREQLLEKFEETLAHSLDYLEDSSVKEAMYYALLGGGKRIRPMLFLTALQDYNIQIEPYLKAACAIEMIHTYSLVHDDLPAMDNDDMRRGRATVHKAFDEATAILAGDGLLSEAFFLLSSLKVDAKISVQLVQVAVQCCGANGMILGQELDLSANELTDLQKMDALKTGCLFALPLRMAAIIAEDQENLINWHKLGTTYGVFFQIQDDLLEVESSSEVIGKTSNKEEDKENYVARFGVVRCKEILKELKEAISNLELILQDKKGVFELLKDTYKRKY